MEFYTRGDSIWRGAADILTDKLLGMDFIPLFVQANSPLFLWASLFHENVQVNKWELESFTIMEIGTRNRKNPIQNHMLPQICRLCSLRWRQSLPWAACQRWGLHRQLASLEEENKASYLFKNSIYSVCLMSPVLIMIVWKHCRSMAQSFTFTRAEEEKKKTNREKLDDFNHELHHAEERRDSGEVWRGRTFIYSWSHHAILFC